MSSEDIDRLLSRNEEIVPSSGFVDSVMNAVRVEGSAPAPIPFPWRRAWPGVAAAVVAVVMVVVGCVVWTEMGAPASSGFAPALEQILKWTARFGVGWTLMALLLALASVKLSMRLAGGSR